MNDARRVTAVIADDEPRLAQYLRERLAALWPELVIAGVAENGPEAKAMIDAEAPDVAFLDIRMPGMTGLEVAQAVAPETHVVFVTAYDQYAVAAFEQAAVDYLLKPVADDRLAQTVERLRERTAERAPQAAGALAATLESLRAMLPHLAASSGGGGGERLAWIRASVGAQVRLIAVDDVCYFQSNDKYTSVFTADGEALIRTSLRELLDQLDPARFWQVHRGTVVNLAHVKATERDLAGRVTLRLKSRPEPVAVSRAFSHRFRQM